MFLLCIHSRKALILICVSDSHVTHVMPICIQVFGPSDVAFLLLLLLFFVFNYFFFFSLNILFRLPVPSAEKLAFHGVCFALLYCLRKMFTLCHYPFHHPCFFLLWLLFRNDTNVFKLQTISREGESYMRRGMEGVKKT